jgi:hypothetical protein
VVVYHFWRPARQSLHFGSIGVRIFFVLSGFLITGIAANHDRRGGPRRGEALRLSWDQISWRHGTVTMWAVRFVFDSTAVYMKVAGVGTDA